MADYETVLAKHGITNINLVGATMGDQRWALGWETPDARFHIWFRVAEGFGSLDETMYKNPPETKPAYHARRLDRTSKVNVPIVDAVVAYAEANDLIGKKQQELRDLRQKQLQKAAEAMRERRVMDAGPALLKALKALVDAPDGINTELWDQAEAAIRLAEGTSQ